MCQAIKDIKNDGIKEGRMEGILNSIKSLMKTLNLSAEQAMNALEVPEDKRAYYLAQI